MKNIYYKSKNSKYPGCSIDEITDDEFKARFEFKIADGTEYSIILISDNELQLRNGNGDIVCGSAIKDNNFRETFKKLLDIAGIKLRDITDNGEELEGINFGEEEFGGEDNSGKEINLSNNIQIIFNDPEMTSFKIFKLIDGKKYKIFYRNKVSNDNNNLNDKDKHGNNYENKFNFIIKDNFRETNLLDKFNSIFKKKSEEIEFLSGNKINCKSDKQEYHMTTSTGRTSFARIQNKNYMVNKAIIDLQYLEEINFLNGKNKDDFISDILNEANEVLKKENKFKKD